MSSMYVFIRKWGSPICHVLLTLQNTHRRALLLIDNSQFIGFLHKQNWAASTDIKFIVTYLALINPSNVAYNSDETQTCNYYFFLFGLTLAKSLLACSCGKRRETLKSRNAAISKYIELVFCCVLEKLLRLPACKNKINSNFAARVENSISLIFLW